MTQAKHVSFGNYEEHIIKALTALGAFPGKKIRVVDKTESWELEGYLLPKTEFTHDNILLLKLDNGYNVGIEFQGSLELSLAEGGIGLESFPRRLPKQKSGLPEVSLLATGGTIASRIDYLTGGVVMALDPEEVFFALPELFEEITFRRVENLYQLGSEDIWYKQWQVLAKHAADELNDQSNGVVVMHGTDAMHFSSAALSFMLGELHKPVALTGGQRSSDRGSFDGALNLISASRVAANADLAEVVVVMHARSDDDACAIHRGTKVRKMHTSRRDAFKSINVPPLGEIDANGVISWNPIARKTRKAEGSVDPKVDFEPRIALIKAYPGSDPDILDWLVDKGKRGVIIEGTGLGHVPSFPPNDEKNRSWLPAIQRATDAGVFIGMTSQTLHGRVHPYVYRALRYAKLSGAIHLEDMLPETAYVKLGWVLANYADEEVPKMMLQNLAGEITERSRFDAY